MADYYPLIAHAVESLDKNTGENRRALYERARTALVAQLRGVVPALAESEITRERLALEEAIRKIEAESARRAREEARMPIRRTDLQPKGNEPRQSLFDRPASPSARPGLTLDPPRPRTASDAPGERPPAQRRSLSDEAMRGFRGIDLDQNQNPPAASPPRSERPEFPRPSQAERTERPERTEQPAQPPAAPAPHPLQEFGELEPKLEPENLWTTSEPVSAERPELATSRNVSRPKPPPPDPLDEVRAPRPRRKLDSRQIVLVLVLILVGALSAVAWWQRDAISGSVGNMFAWVRTPSKPAPAPEPTTQVPPKNNDRIGQPQIQQQPGAPVAQRVVLYEEDPDDPQGKRLVGSVIWNTEVVPPAPGRQAEIAVRARIDVPERKMSVNWSLRRNTDPSLPASHTIEIMFNLPPDTPSGGVQNVPGVLMKQSEQTRGVPLAGLAVKVTPGYFLIGLSSLESDMQRNIQLLKDRSWFDIPIVYNNNRRAILAMEKGVPGEKAFADAFGAWRQ